mgnify:CR=1 FL=1
MSTGNGIAQEPLAEELVQAVQALAGQYSDRRASGVEALKLVQRRYRWVSDAHLHALARLLDMTVDELDGVATYYNLVYRRPVGRHVILRPPCRSATSR